MKQFALLKDELLDLINNNRKAKNSLFQEDIFVNEIKLSYLKVIDKIFKKGLAYYTDFSPFTTNKSISIFFRKNKFQGDLTLRDRQVVTEFEDVINHIKIYNTLSEFSLKRVLKKYTVKDDPKVVGNQSLRRLGSP